MSLGPAGCAGPAASRVEPPDPPLSDGTIALRLWREEDVPAIAAACNGDEEISRWLDRIPQPYREEHARAWLRVCVEGWASGRSLPFAVVDAESGELLGSIHVHRLPEEDGVGEVGYWVARPARGRRVATRAVRLVARWALAEVGIARLQLRTDVDNAASQRVAERAGFRREGVLRSCRFNPRRGRRVDFALYSLLPGELAVGPPDRPSR